MYRDIAKLVLYRNLGENSILMKLSGIFEDFDRGDCPNAELVARIYDQIKRLLDLATDYGFDTNLWHNYLAFILITNENSFSMTSEKVGANDGTVNYCRWLYNYFAKNDFKIFKKLFDFDFSEIEEALDIDCFTIVNNYKAIGKKERMYNKNVSTKVQDISRAIEGAKDENDIFKIVTDFYKAYGVGMFGLNKAFRIVHPTNGDMQFVPINNTEDVRLDDLIGYEIQKQKIVENTEAFVAGRKANNALLFGDSGTGKSTTIKAIINEYYDQGLRMIEIYKHQFQDLSQVISQIKNRNYRFIIYMDDLSFEEFETEYKYLKAVIEGGLEIKPDNVLIYATSNRRHLIRETWTDRTDLENNNGMHKSDTMQEKLSLVNRFGVTINYSKPSQKEYFQIVVGLAEKNGIHMTEEELCAEANKWELSHGGISGRTAQQFINYLAGKQE